MSEILDAETTDFFPHVTVVSTFANRLTEVMQTAFHDAQAGRGNMHPDVYKVGGFCGQKFRLFLNNLMRGLAPDVRYLEVGIFEGATFSAALSNNDLVAVGVDDWSWAKEKDLGNIFYRNLAKFRTRASKISVIDRDFHELQIQGFGAFNVYFYDGDHSEQSQYDAIMWVKDALDDQSVILVDDWNWVRVRRATLNAIRDAGLHIQFMIELRTSFDDKIPRFAFGGSDWHNGFFGAVVTKRPIAAPGA